MVHLTGTMYVCRLMSAQMIRLTERFAADIFIMLRLKFIQNNLQNKVNNSAMKRNNFEKPCTTGTV
jgi:hypothetical protein